MTTAASSAPARHARGVGLMVFSALAFTANVLLIRALGELQSINVWLVSTVRFVVGLAVVVAFYWRDFEPTHLFRNPKLAVRGLLGSAGVYGYYLTVVHLGAGRATFINNTYVVWGALLAVWLLGERFRWPLAVGGLAALAGLALLTHAFDRGAAVDAYDLLAILVAFGSAHIVITIRQLHATEHTSTIFAAQCVYGLLLCTPPAVLQAAPATPAAWAFMAAAGLCAALGQIAMTRSFRDLTVAEGSLLRMLVPLGIAVGGAVFFAERFSPVELAGAALIFAGSALPAVRR